MMGGFPRCGWRQVDQYTHGDVINKWGIRAATTRFLAMIDGRHK